PASSFDTFTCVRSGAAPGASPVASAKTSGFTAFGDRPAGAAVAMEAATAARAETAATAMRIRLPSLAPVTDKRFTERGTDFHPQNEPSCRLVAWAELGLSWSMGRRG